MSDIKNMVYDRVPRWYELSLVLDGKRPNIAIEIHAAVIDQIVRLCEHCDKSITAKTKALDLDTFVPVEVGKPWGYNSILCPQPSGKLGLVWEVEIPKISKGNRSTVNWQTAYAVSASLAVIVQALRFAFTETNEPQFQLFAIDYLSTEKEMHGGALGATVGLDLQQWLSTQRQENLTQVSQTMQNAWEAMWPKSGMYHNFDFRTRIAREGQLHLTVPGNACGLDPADYYDPEESRGYKVGPHNVDSPLQQLSLLCGLIKLGELARKNGV